MKFKIFTNLMVLLALTLSGCGGGGGGSTTSSSASTIITDKNVTITGNPHVESLGKANSLNVTINIGNTPKTLYLLLSNYATTSTNPTIAHNPKILKVTQPKKTVSMNSVKKFSVSRETKDLKKFKSTMHTLFSHTPKQQQKTIAVPQRLEDVVGTSQAFILDIAGTTTQATARRVDSNISTVLGPITLNIWVSNDSFDSGAGCMKAKCVTQAMVDTMATNFLKSGLDNDIYDWVTNVYGKEWGSNTNTITNLIPNTNEITILLTDINNDNSTNGGVIGFFYAKDNFLRTALSSSNERIMFYTDSVLFANGSPGNWNINDFWPKEMISTLAHEFQHMIHFYQKTILLANGATTDTWMNEMLSETTEDLVATKINSIGPRGVVPTDGSAGSTNNQLGRYPLFNANNTLSLTSWNSQLSDYSKVNAFGAYLIRNYGGAKVLHDIMYNASVNQQAVVAAVNATPNGAGKTFDDLLREWGVAVLLSDNTNLLNLPTYNTGAFTPDFYNNSAYQLGSVNFFNYAPQPILHTAAGTVDAQGNYYYKVGNNLTGTVNISLNLNGQTEVTLIAK